MVFSPNFFKGKWWSRWLRGMRRINSSRAVFKMLPEERIRDLVFSLSVIQNSVKSGKVVGEGDPKLSRHDVFAMLSSLSRYKHPSGRESEVMERVVPVVYSGYDPKKRQQTFNVDTKDLKRLAAFLLRQKGQGKSLIDRTISSLKHARVQSDIAAEWYGLPMNMKATYRVYGAERLKENMIRFLKLPGVRKKRRQKSIMDYKKQVRKRQGR